MRALLVLVMVFVVVPGVLAQRTKLPVGSAEAVKAFVDREVNYMVCSVGTNTSSGGFRSVAAVPVVVSHKCVTEDVSVALPSLLAALLRKVSSPDGRSYVIQVDAQAQNPGGPSYTATMIVWKGSPFRLVRGSDGVWSFPPDAFNPAPEEFYTPEFTNGRSSFVGVYAPECKWVEDRWDYPDGRPPYIHLTRNGFEADCPSGKPVSEGGFLGNGFVYFPGETLSGANVFKNTADPSVIETITIWYDEGRTVGDSFVVNQGVGEPWSPIGYLHMAVVSVTAYNWTKVQVSGCMPDEFYTILSGDVEGMTNTSTFMAYGPRMQVTIPKSPEQQELGRQFFRVRPATPDERRAALAKSGK